MTVAPLTPSAFLSSVGSSVLSGGKTNTNNRAAISNGAELNDAIASQLFGTGSTGNSSSATEGLSPFLSDVSTASTFNDAITNALLGGDSSGQSVQDLASLGATLNEMAQTAQSALSTTSSTARTQDLDTYQQLFTALDQSSASIDGTAGNAASLGISSPGDWGNSDSAAATAAIVQDMTAVVKAHTQLQNVIQSISAALTDSFLLG
jgi:hypothetical protein